MRKFLANSAQHFDTEVNRNVFDISKTHQASYNFGKIYPMYWREIQANETISIKEQHSFEMDVLNHPLANNIKLNTAFFYVRYKALYDDWEKFIRQPPTTKQSAYAIPFLSGRDAQFFGIGSLANHFGIPAVQYGTAAANRSLSYTTSKDKSRFTEFLKNLPFDFSYDTHFGMHSSRIFSTSNSQVYNGSTSLTDLINNSRPSLIGPRFQVLGQPIVEPLSGNCVFKTLYHGNIGNQSIILRFWNDSGMYLYTVTFSKASSGATGTYKVDSTTNHSSTVNGDTVDALNLYFYLPATLIEFLNTAIGNGQKIFVSLHETGRNGLYPTVINSSFPLQFISGKRTETDSYYYSGFFDVLYYSVESETSSVVDSPFSGDHPRIPLPSWLFRAYIGCYNAHFRNRLLNPLLDDDGSILTDHCLPTSMRQGGADLYPYEFQFCQYQPDIFNQCLVSPTGNMYDQPLVGITRNQELADQPGSAILHYKQDGQSYDVEVSLDGLGNMTGITNYTADTNHMIIDTLKDAIAYGIPIVAMKNVEALSKWLTATYRGGLYSYNDFIAAHFGKPSHYRNQLTPEYLGGNTTYINSSSVVNTGQAPGQGQGELVGRGSFHGGDDKIVCHADDYGLIIGLCWFSVQTASAQHLDRHFLRFLPGDFATPEFANLGCEPIPYKMLAPLQTTAENQDKTFGYQRIYGDKLWAFDTIAGDYLDTYQGDIMVRRYDSLPQLTNDFVLMKPGELTNPFITDMDLDHLRGFWQFDTNIVTWLNQTPNQIVM